MDDSGRAKQEIIERLTADNAQTETEDEADADIENVRRGGSPCPPIDVDNVCTGGPPCLPSESDEKMTESQRPNAEKVKMRILDNKINGLVIDALRESAPNHGEASILTNELSLFAWNEMRKDFSQLDSVRLLLATSARIASADSSEKLLAAALLGGAEERRFRNRMTGPGIARDFAEWQKRKARFRILNEVVGYNLYCFNNADGTTQVAVQGSSSFTMPGLGVTPSKRSELNNIYDDIETAGKISEVFQEHWRRAGDGNSGQEKLLEAAKDLYSNRSALSLYYWILTNLFQNSLTELAEDRIIKPRTGIHDTVVWKKLFRFQRDGVLGAIDKLERYNGCIIADSVGLGKTFEALAVIKYYELRNDRVLVLAPKKLRENWTVYTVNDKRNLLAADRFNYDVLNHTDLTRQTGKSGEINLKTRNWGNYDLVVIDESHNFRNNPGSTDSLTHYGRLMRDVIRSGVKTKVLMLSATPVNNRMNDLKNQIAFITEGNDTALEEHGVKSIEQTLRRAQAQFNLWLKLDAEDRTTKNLLDSLGLDYFNLLDRLTIARSRKHIEKYYDTTEIGKFPQREKPKNIKADIDTSHSFPPLEEVNRDILGLNLSAYQPLQYVMPDKLAKYNEQYDMILGSGGSFRQIDREENLTRLMRINLLKRMESSIGSFGETVSSLLTKAQKLIDRIEAYRESAEDSFSIEDIDLDDEEFERFMVGTKTKVLLKDVDRIRWRQDLAEDAELLGNLLAKTREVDAARDHKLYTLKQLLKEKVSTPLNPGNKKSVVFTAFADTAEYLYEHIAPWALRELGVHTAVVTGSRKIQTTLKGVALDFASVLTAFSPISKERIKMDPDAVDEIDFLIATDCISEGQNLQDCDFLVNYDIHWNPVRIIQRFGRIDRIGSKNDSIQLVNFWPNMELDEYINLERRVSGRMMLLDISATGEENLIDSDSAKQMNDLEYRRRQLEQLQNEVVNLEDLADGMSITDLTLNDYRMDLAGRNKEYDMSSDGVPLGVFAVVRASAELPELKPGVFFCLRSESPIETIVRSYPLAPHYVVYVGEDGAVLENYNHARKSLDLLKKLTFEKPDRDDEAYRRFEVLTHNGKEMGRYQEHLAQAVSAITGQVEEQGVESLFKPGGTSLSKGDFKGVDDFEVVAYLVVLGENE